MAQSKVKLNQFIQDGATDGQVIAWDNTLSLYKPITLSTLYTGSGTIQAGTVATFATGTAPKFKYQNGTSAIDFTSNFATKIASGDGLSIGFFQDSSIAISVNAKGLSVTETFSAFNNKLYVNTTGGAQEASAALQVLSTTGLLYPPIMTETQRDAITPINGGVLYNSTAAKFQGRQAGAWVDLGGSGGGGGALSAITAATASNAIDNLNFVQTWDWSTLTTNTGLLLGANGLTTGTILSVSSTNGSLDSAAGLLYVANEGASTNGYVAQLKANSTTGTGLVIKADNTSGFGTDSPTSILSISAQNTIAAPTSDTVLHVTGADSSTNAVIQLDLHNAGATGPVYFGRHARGTAASPTATQSGDVLSDYAGAGYGTSAYGALIGGMEIKAAQAFTNTAQGTSLTLSTTLSGTTTRTDRLVIANDGVITIGNLNGGGVAGAVNASNTGVLTNSKVFITSVAAQSFLTLASGSTLTTAANFTTAGANALTLTTTGVTNVTLPTTGTLSAIAGTETLTNKRINPRVTSVAYAAAPTPDVSTTDLYIMTAASGTVTFGVPAGTPVNGQRLTYRIKDNGTLRTLAWNAIYRAMGVGLPAGTVASKIMYIGLIYDSDAVKWDVVSVSNEP